MNRFVAIAASALMAIALSGCGGEEKKPESQSVQNVGAKANENMNNGAGQQVEQKMPEEHKQ